MSAQHTPGPWKVVSPSDVYPGIEAKNFSVVIFGGSSDDGGVRGRTHDETLANAHLIAAAPELLAALEEQEKAEQWIASNDTSSPLFSETVRLKLNHAADLRQAALKKAKGETP